MCHMSYDTYIFDKSCHFHAKQLALDQINSSFYGLLILGKSCAPATTNHLWWH